MEASKLINVSTRLRVETGDSVGIAGFVIGGDQARRVVVRAVGPSLTGLGIQGVLTDPTLEVRDSRGQVVARNEDWQINAGAPGSGELDVGQTPFPPRDPRESAVALSLAPGAYTAIVQGVSGDVGIALVEVYDLDPANADSQAVNVSTRGMVRVGEGALIGGFVVRGAKPLDVIVRALGPSLVARGVAAALQDPSLEIRNASGALVASSDNTSAADATSLGDLLPGDEREAAVKVSLQPGSYTAIVRGKADSSGVALVEVYER